MRGKSQGSTLSLKNFFFFSFQMRLGWVPITQGRAKKILLQKWDWVWGLGCQNQVQRNSTHDHPNIHTTQQKKKKTKMRERLGF